MNHFSKKKKNYVVEIIYTIRSYSRFSFFVMGDKKKKPKSIILSLLLFLVDINRFAFFFCKRNTDQHCNTLIDYHICSARKYMI